MRQFSMRMAKFAFLFLWMARFAQADINFTSGHFYADSASSHTINEYDVSGAAVGSLILPTALSTDLRGLAFGPDHLLYVVAPNGFPPAGVLVYALDSGGNVHSTYTFAAGDVGSNAAFGKIAFDASGHFYVGSFNGIIRFDVGNTQSGQLLQNSSITDVFGIKPLPNGDLLTLTETGLYEMTSNGGLVKQYGGAANTMLDPRGMTYDSVSNTIFLTMLGPSNLPNQLMKLDGTTGDLITSTVFVNGTDMLIDMDGRLIVGSRTDAPGIFTQDLSNTGSLGATPEMFVTQDVPEPVLLPLLPAIALLSRRRR